MFAQTAEAGTPKLTLKWPKSSAIQTMIAKTDEGRFTCHIKVNDGEYFALPGSHPTELDANRTLAAYIAENQE